MTDVVSVLDIGLSLAIFLSTMMLVITVMFSKDMIFIIVVAGTLLCAVFITIVAVILIACMASM